MSFLRYASGQTDRQTDILTDTFMSVIRTPYGEGI